MPRAACAAPESRQPARRARREREVGARPCQISAENEAQRTVATRYANCRVRSPRTEPPAMIEGQQQRRAMAGNPVECPLVDNLVKDARLTRYETRPAAGVCLRPRREFAPRATARPGHYCFSSTPALVLWFSTTSLTRAVLQVSHWPRAPPAGSHGVYSRPRCAARRHSIPPSRGQRQP